MTFDSMRDVRLDHAAEAHGEVSGHHMTCEVCGGVLPRGLGRVRCLAHSPYAQAVAREVAREVARRRGSAQVDVRRAA